MGQRDHDDYRWTPTAGATEVGCAMEVTPLAVIPAQAGIQSGDHIRRRPGPGLSTWIPREGCGISSLAWAPRRRC